MRTFVAVLFLPLLLGLALPGAKRQPHIRYVNPPELFKPVGFSQVVEVKAGRLVFVSGQVGVDSTLKTVAPGDFRAQTEKAFQNLQAALAAVGAGFENVVKMNTYLADVSNYQVFREVRAQYMKSAPASTLVQAKTLREDVVIEIEVIAVLPD